MEKIPNNWDTFIGPDDKEYKHPRNKKGEFMMRLDDEEWIIENGNLIGLRNSKGEIRTVKDWIES